MTTTRESLVREEIYKRKYEELVKQKKEEEHKKLLPHLYGMPWYKWSWDFFNTEKKKAFIFAGNQLGKSSTQIRRCIRMATDKKFQKKLWRKPPRIFWYLYPDINTIRTEVITKWIPDFLPRAEMEHSYEYGYEIFNLSSKTKAPEIHFTSSGDRVIIYFKAYSQNVHNLQASSVDAIFADEELPVDIFPELMFRLAATDGYFSQVCTATRGQQFWKDVIEYSDPEFERFPEAFKIQVSAYDCLTYMDGSPSPWTKERIKALEESCKDQNEIDKRIHGKFIKEGNLKVPEFNPYKNVCAPYDITNWRIYVGIDIGSGGERHPSTICFVAVRPDYKKAAVFRGWIGRGVLTTSIDVVEKLRQIRGSMKPVCQSYDHHARDFFITATRLGESLIPAEKSQELGFGLINDLFKYGMLDIFNIHELNPLVDELLNVNHDVAKKDAIDDFVDSMRYAVMAVPFDFSDAKIPIPVLEKREADEIFAKKEKSYTTEMARRGLPHPEPEEHDTLENELDFWNGLYDN